MQLAIIIHHTEIDIHTGKPNLLKAIKGIEIHIGKQTLTRGHGHRGHHHTEYDVHTGKPRVILTS